MNFSMFGVVITGLLFSAQIIVPVEGEVLRQFEQPECEYCAGHRGVTIATTTGADVVAVADGVITFAGQVGGQLYVVQRIAADVRVTYGWMTEKDEEIVDGSIVKQGAPLGVTGQTMYLGVRVGDIYVEPLRFLGLGRARLYGPGRVVVQDRGIGR